MKQPTATQLEMAAIDPGTALGTPGLHTAIGDVPVTVSRGAAGHVVVTDDRGTHHDFSGAGWPGVKRSMEDYFEIVRAGR